MPKIECMEPAKQYKIIARMLDSGKITIPQEVRVFMDLKKGDYVEVIITKLDMSIPKEDKET